MKTHLNRSSHLRVSNSAQKSPAHLPPILILGQPEQDLHPPSLEAWKCLSRFVLWIFVLVMIAQAHGCHPGGHDETVDDELIHQSDSGS